MKAALPIISARRVGPHFQVAGAISDAQWKQIEQILANVGVNANVMKVGCRYIPDVRRWSVNDPGVPQRRLRAVLEEMAYCCILREHYGSPTPKQRAEQFEEARTATEKARDLLRDATWVFPHYPDRDLNIDQEKDDALDRLLTWKIADLQERINKLSAGGSSSKQNRLTRYSEYWRGLMALWRAIVKGKRLRKRQLHPFLLACSQPPLSANVVPGKLGKMMDYFFKNLT